MKKMKWQLFRYYWKVKSFLPCSHKLKKRCICDLKADVEEFLEQNPQADFAAVQDRFGSPRQIAAAFVDEADTEQLLRRLRIRRLIVTATSVVTVAALIVLGVLYYRGAKKIDDTFGGYIVKNVYEIDAPSIEPTGE